MQQSQGLTQDNIMVYLGMVEKMINEMIKQYAYLLAEKLKIGKDLTPDDPVIVTLHNILMVAPKQDGSKSELNINDVLREDEDNNDGMEDEDMPMYYGDFKKKF
jgi:hypothetical protein